MIFRGILIKSSQKSKIGDIKFNDIIQYHNDERWFSRGCKYFKVDDYSPEDKNIKGEFLVFKRNHPITQEIELSISYDFLNALGLYKSGNNYCNPARNDEIAIKTECNNENFTYSVLIKKEYLLDYLSARKMDMLFEIFIERRHKSASELSLCKTTEQAGNYLYELWFSRTLPNGMLPNESAMVVTATYKDINPNDDVPVFDRENMDVKTESIKSPNEPLLYNYFAQFRKFYILSNDNYSEIILGDKPQANFDYYIDNTNRKVISKKLKDKVQFLWFKPNVIKVLFAENYTTIKWRTANIATIYFGTEYFDIALNREGLVNVFITDIINLSPYYQKIWHAYNCPPSGGVSEEFLALEMECKNIDTDSPEILLEVAISEFDSAFYEKYEKHLIKQTDEKSFKNKIDRFTAISKSDCFTLCKNINSYVTERFDLSVLKEKTSNLDKNIGSLKRLEILLTEKNKEVHNIISPLFVVYDMRIVDSHIAKESDSIFQRLGITLTGNEDNFVIVGAIIIFKVAKCLHDLAEIIKTE